MFPLMIADQQVPSRVWTAFVDEERLQLIRAHLRDDLEPVWEEPFHESWIANSDPNQVTRLARAHRAAMAAAKPFIKPGEIIIGNDVLRSTVHGKGWGYRAGVCLDREYLSLLRSERPADTDRLEQIESYWSEWLPANQPDGAVAMHGSAGYDAALERGLDGMGRDFPADLDIDGGDARQRRQ